MRKGDFPNSQYHPDFSSADGRVDLTVILVSREKMLFCVNESVLRASSSVFDTILSLPQPTEDTPSDLFIDNLDESATTLEGLLRMITGRELPPLDTIEAIEPLVLAAHKWKMSGPLSILKMILVRDTTFAQNNPIRVYSLGCRLKWGALVTSGAKYSCNYHIYYHQVIESVLETMDPADLLRLVRFHRRRRDCMRAYFDGNALGKMVCIYSPQYQSLRAKFLEFMDNNSPGKPLGESALRNLVAQSRLETHDTLACRLRNDGDEHPGRLSGTATIDFVVPKLLVQWKALPQDISTP